MLEAAVSAGAGPWHVRPDLGFVDAPDAGVVHVVRKGGCCLAYTGDRPLRDPDDPSLDEGIRDYLRCFPDVPGQPRYCTTCSFRTFDDAAAHQVFWRARR